MEEYFRQMKKQVQRPWGKCVFVVFEEQGSQSSWNGMNKEKRSGEMDCM
jgi:hypothetical protein